MSGEVFPNQTILLQMVEAFSKASSPDRHVQKQLQEFNDNMRRDPAYQKYLCLIFARHQVDPPINVREMAGLLLKSSMTNSLHQMPPETADFCSTAALLVVREPNTAPQLKKTAANVLPAVITASPAQSQKIVEDLCQNSSQAELVEPILKCLFNICEDNAPKLEENLVQMITTVCLQNFNHGSSVIRALAIGTSTFLVSYRNQPLDKCGLLDNYIRGLYSLATDQDIEVKKNVCKGFVMALEANHEKLNLKDLIPYMLNCTRDQNPGIALEACEFWTALFEKEDYFIDILQPHLKDLIETLLRGMVYTDEEIASLGADEESHVEDRPEDIQPRFHKAKSHTVESGDGKQQRQPGQPVDEDDEDDEDDDDGGMDSGSGWTLRKCSAAALDMMATVYADEILKFFLPCLKTLLDRGAASAGNWKELECGILALGAIAEGCKQDIVQYLPDLVIFMVTNCITHPMPLVRSITCWTLSRYSQWIVRGGISGTQEQHTQHLMRFFAPTLHQVLVLVIDRNKRVQQAACSALATIEEEACENLVPFLPQILKYMAHAFTIYKQRNLLVLYDAVGTLADSVGLELSKPEFIPILMQPLVKKWQDTHDDNRDIFPLFECLANVAIALGDGFAPFAENVWKRCINIIKQTLVAAESFHQQGGLHGNVEEPDMDFVVVSLDLLCGITQGLRTNVMHLIAQTTQPSLMDLVLICIKYPSNEVKQSAIALLGDLSSFAFQCVLPHIESQVMPLLVNQLARSKDEYQELSVCNNATWALGEIALQMGEAIGPFIMEIMKQLAHIIMDEQTGRRTSLLENAAITIGRLAYVCPDSIAQMLGDILPHWCKALRQIHDNLEKESAYLGLCKVAVKNPEAVFKFLVFFCDTAVRWESPTPELNQKLGETLHYLRNLFGPQWNEKAIQIPEAVRERLRQRYNLV
ncbi:hypothetical protein HDU97_000579 [Phlyctochytrium planicorne]|nr:hypothetical protein HDU97_000579 [Phlyctochytrium planicorne]